MTLSDIDRQLLERCLNNEAHSWEAFIDRFLGLVVHVINHTASSRGMKITPAERDDLVSEVFLALLNNNCAVLRRFRRQSSLATYLTVISRRVAVHKIGGTRQVPLTGAAAETNRLPQESAANRQLENRDQIERLMLRLDSREADVIRMHHLEGKSYQEISAQLGMPENSVGPTLSRAREKMRAAEAAGS